MMQGALLAILVGSLRVAATPEPNAWQRWGGVIEQRSPGQQIEERQNDGAVPYVDTSLTTTSTATASPFSDAAPASTAVETVFSSSVPLTAVPATTAGPSSYEIHSFSSTVLKVASTLINGEVYAISEVGQFEFITIYDVVTVTGTISAATLGSNSTSTASSSLMTTEGSSAALLASSTAIFANSTSSAAPTSVSEISSSLALNTESSSAAPQLSSTGIFANSTVSAAPTSVLKSSSSLILTTESGSSAFVLSTIGIFGNSTTSAFTTSIPEPPTSSSLAVLEPSTSNVFASSTTSAEPISTPELSTSTSEAFSTTLASPPGSTSQNITRSRTRSVRSAASSTSAYTFTTLTRPFPSQNDTATAYLTTLPPPESTALTATTPLSYSSEALVIETTLTATITGPVISTAAPSRSVSITATVTGPGLHHHHGHHAHGNAPQPTGTPSPSSAYCGVHGSPLGVDLMGTYFFNGNNRPVTLEGCYQFCQLARIHGKGCMSFYFHEREGLAGSSACDIYGGPINVVVRALDDNEETVWYDASCPNPVTSG